MNVAISKSEKIDIFLALTAFYCLERKTENNLKLTNGQINLTLQDLSALDEKTHKLLEERAKRFENLSVEKQNIWLKFWLEKLRSRGQTKRLDENIHQEHIIKLINNEPRSIQSIICSNLPANLAKRIYESNPEINPSTNHLTVTPNNKILKIIRQRFLSNFVAYDNIYKPNIIDEMSGQMLENFIWNIGIRETAIVCRGIKTKENLALFLKPFGEELTKRIAIKITELEHISASRVIDAEQIIRDLIEDQAASKKQLKELGLRLIAMTFVSRDENAKRYMVQKLSIIDGDLLTKFIKQFENKNTTIGTRANLQLNNISKEILDLALK